MTDQRWQGILVFGFFALIFLGACVWVLFRTRTFATRSVGVLSVVTELKSFSRGMGTGDGFIVFFRFDTHEGRQIQGKSTFAVKNPPAVGATVPVRYEPQKPERARLDGPEHRATGIIASLFISGAFGVLMSALLLFRVI